MKAVVYKEPYTVAVEDVDDPQIQDPTDAIIRITTSAIRGSDLHMYEGRTGADAGIVFGHENLGIVEEVGPGVGKLKKGDRIVLQRTTSRSSPPMTNRPVGTAHRTESSAGPRTATSTTLSSTSPPTRLHLARGSELRRRSRAPLRPPHAQQ